MKKMTTQKQFKQEMKILYFILILLSTLLTIEIYSVHLEHEMMIMIKNTACLNLEIPQNTETYSGVLTTENVSTGPCCILDGNDSEIFYSGDSTGIINTSNMGFESKINNSSFNNSTHFTINENISIRAGAKMINNSFYKVDTMFLDAHCYIEISCKDKDIDEKYRCFENRCLDN